MKRCLCVFWWCFCCFTFAIHVLFSTFFFFLPTLTQIQEWKRRREKKNPDGLFQPGPSHPRSVNPSEKVWGKLNQSGVKVADNGSYCHRCHRGWVRRQHGQGLPEKSADLQLLCRFYFLISNLRQPPHNNMADPACGSGATQLETRPSRLQLFRAGQRDKEAAHRPRGGVNPCGGGRWDRRREKERRGGPFMEEEKEGSRLRLEDFQEGGSLAPPAGDGVIPSDLTACGWDAKNRGLEEDFHFWKTTI